MERGRFDALARLLGAEGNRRAALGALLGAVMLGSASDPADAVKKRGKRRKRKERKERKPAKPKICFGTGACSFRGAGKDYDDCDFAGSTEFAGENAGGSSFRRANLADMDLEGTILQGTKFLNATLNRANLRGADLNGASLNRACLFDADFLDADTGGPDVPIFANPYLCRTRLPNGFVADRDCLTAPKCCRG